MNLVSTLIIGFLIGFSMTFIYELTHGFLGNKIKKEIKVVIKGFHLHHSIYGLILFIFCLMYSSPFLFALGLGTIARHTHSEKKFTFIDKN